MKVSLIDVGNIFGGLDLSILVFLNVYVFYLYDFLEKMCCMRYVLIIILLKLVLFICWEIEGKKNSCLNKFII